MKLIVKKGRTSLLVKLFIQDSSSSVGAGLTGLTSGSSGLVCYRARDDDGNAAGTQITLSGGTKGTWSSGGFVEKDATNMPGVYEFGVTDASIATGSEGVVIMLKGATNMAPLALEIQLVAYDPQSTGLGLSNVSSNVVQWANAGVASPLTAGIPEVNIKNINNVSATAITTINANVGTTQPINFTGTAGSALIKSDVTDIATVAVSATTAQLGVNVVNWNNTVVATPGTAGIPDVNTKNIGNQTAALDANNLLKVDVEDVNGSASVETGINVKQALQYCAAALAGVLTGAAGTTITISAINNSGTTRITATVDANDNRTAVVLS